MGGNDTLAEGSGFFVKREYIHKSFHLALCVTTYTHTRFYINYFLI